MEKKNVKSPTTRKSENSAAREAFVLRLNGKIVPWVIVISIIIFVLRAGIAEFRLAQLEHTGKDRENRLRVLEDRPQLPKEQ